MKTFNITIGKGRGALRIRLPILLVLVASCGGGSPLRNDDPPPTCVDVANKVHANCVDLSDQPCEAAVYEAAYRACTEQTRAGKPVCVPKWDGRCSSEWVPADPVTNLGQVDTSGEGKD